MKKYLYNKRTLIPTLKDMENYSKYTAVVTKKKPNNTSRGCFMRGNII